MKIQLSFECSSWAMEGQDSTGKLMLIGAITETFRALEAEDMLAKRGTSGVPAVIIGGETLHSWAAIPIRCPRKEDWVNSNNQTTQKQKKTKYMRLTVSDN